MQILQFASTLGRKSYFLHIVDILSLKNVKYCDVQIIFEDVGG